MQLAVRPSSRSRCGAQVQTTDFGWALTWISSAMERHVATFPWTAVTASRPGSRYSDADAASEEARRAHLISSQTSRDATATSSKAGRVPQILRERSQPGRPPWLRVIFFLHSATCYVKQVIRSLPLSSAAPKRCDAARALPLPLVSKCRTHVLHLVNSYSTRRGELTRPGFGPASSRPHISTRGQTGRLDSD